MSAIIRFMRKYFIETVYPLSKPEDEIEQQTPEEVEAQEKREHEEYVQERIADFHGFLLGTYGYSLEGRHLQLPHAEEKGEVTLKDSRPCCDNFNFRS